MQFTPPTLLYCLLILLLLLLFILLLLLLLLLLVCFMKSPVWRRGRGRKRMLRWPPFVSSPFFFPFLFWSFWSFWTVLTFLSPSLASTPSPTPLWLCFKTKTPNKLDNKTKNPQKLEDWNEPFSFYIYIYLSNLKQRKTKKQRKETIIIKHFTQVPCRILLDSKRVHSTPESRSLLIVAIVIIIIITFPMIEYWLDVWEGGRRRRRRRKRRIERIQSSMRMFQRMFQRMSDVPCLPHLPFFLLKIVKKKERIRSQLFVSHRTLWKEMKNERLKNKNCYL